MKLKYKCLWMVLYVSFGAHGQSNIAFTQVKDDKSYDSAIDLYEKSIGRNSHLNNGSEYIDIYRSVRGHQFYKSNDWEVGSIKYQNQWYHGVEMKYEIVNDELIVGHFDERGYFSTIKLIDIKVEGFEFLSDKFVRIQSSPNQSQWLSDGFYKVIYEGNTFAYAKYKKQREQRVTSNDRFYEFSQKTKYYVIVEDKAYTIGKKKSLLNAFSLKEKEIKSYLKKNKIRLKENKEIEISEVVAYYDQIMRLDQ